MSTATVHHVPQPQAQQFAPAPKHNVSFGGTMKSEWIKISSLRSTWWSLGTIVVVALGLSVLMAFTMTIGSIGDVPPELGTALAVQVATFPLTLTSLVAAVLGVLMISGEYSTGMIRSTFTAVPKRTPAFIAKGAILFVILLVIGWVTTFGGFLFTAGIRDSVGIGASIGDEGVLVALLSGGLVLALVGLMAYGIGAIVRSAAGGIAISVAILMILPILVSILSQFGWAEGLADYLPANAGQVLYSMPANEFMGTGNAMEYWQALLVLLAWVAVAIIPAGILLKRRDV
ncbi:ABC transporter permease subunit [Lysinibacter cavernae]|uniref:ABC-2 type transport system permease protein n=1 Tax=Lysinibacter cavernae TaxID=1640652 RepID=A0A7X5R2F2_9MICO|nr:ABC transporter permease subunit [Lysinibacter cavernae]NIH54311.1 ABC-2 type transport system permease protein [Lysinibacter cavernae]